MYYLGLDVGTTGIKAVVYNENWEIVGTGFQECGISHPGVNRSEQDAEQIWLIAKKIIRFSTSKCKKRVGAISVSVQGDAVLAVDRNWNALCPVQLGIDYRGRKEAQLCEQSLGAYELFRSTGMRPHPLNSFVKMLNIQRETPVIYDRAYKLVTYSDYILGKLGSETPSIDYTMATRTMCMDITTLDWDDRILNTFGFDRAKLSTPVSPGSVVGTVSATLAEELGVMDRCLVVAGGHDQACAPLGAGIWKSCSALDSHGTAEVISTVFEQPRTGNEMFESYYPCSAYTIDGLYYSFALLHMGGILLKWFVESICPDILKAAQQQGSDPYQLLTKEMPQEPSPLLVIPYFNGSGTPSCNLDAKGAILGLTLNSTRGDMTRAITEALCFEAKYNFETLEHCGIPIREVRCVGGGSKSDVGMQIKADVWGMPIYTLQRKEAACLGAAMLAAKGAGVFSSCEEGARSLIKTERCFEPNPVLNAYYRERYQEYMFWAKTTLQRYGG